MDLIMMIEILMITAGGAMLVYFGMELFEELMIKRHYDILQQYFDVFYITAGILVVIGIICIILMVSKLIELYPTAGIIIKTNTST